MHMTLQTARRLLVLYHHPPRQPKQRTFAASPVSNRCGSPRMAGATVPTVGGRAAKDGETAI
jgi:hypothetical protein